MNFIDPATRNGLVIAIGKKLESSPLDPGDYHLNGLVSLAVDVKIRKAEPSLYRPTTSLPLKAVLAVALRLAGVAAEDITRIVTAAAVEALTNGHAVAIETTETGLKAVEGMLDKLPAQRREGATKVIGGVHLVEFEAAWPTAVCLAK